MQECSLSVFKMSKPSKGTNHVIPINDLIKHMTSLMCPCNPVFKDGIVIHHAADGREYFEPGGSVVKEQKH